MTTLVKLGVGDHVHDLKTGREFAFFGRLADNRIQLRALEDNEIVPTTDQQMCDRLFAGEIRLTVSRSKWLKPVEHILVKDFEQLPEKDQMIARKRHPYAEAIESRCSHTGSRREIEKVAREVALERGETPQSATTIWRYTKRWIASGGDLRSLVPGHNEKRRDPIHTAEVEEIIDVFLAERYCTPEPETITAIYAALKLQIRDINRARTADCQLWIPEISTLYRRAREIDPHLKMLKQKGRHAADAHFKQRNKGQGATRPLETVYIDNTRVDLGTTWDGHWLGRPWLWVALDLYTRMILAVFVSYDPPSYRCVAQCMLNLIKPKTWLKSRFPGIKHDWPCFGVPETIVIDNAPELRSTSLDAAGLLLKINIQRARVRTPEDKGPCERVFRTLNANVFHRFRGTTFSNPQKRGDYDVKRRAATEVETLRYALHKYVVDVYSRSYHRGLKNAPLDQWTEGVTAHPVRLPPDLDSLHVLMAQEGHAAVTNDGIVYEGLVYNSPLLAHLIPEPGKIRRLKRKVDLDNIGTLWVQDPLKKVYHPIPCLAADYAEGLSAHQHYVISKLQRERAIEKIDENDLLEQKEELYQLIKGNLSHKQPGALMRAARFVGPDNPAAATAAPPAASETDLPALIIYAPRVVQPTPRSLESPPKPAPATGGGHPPFGLADARAEDTDSLLAEAAAQGWTTRARPIIAEEENDSSVG